MLSGGPSTAASQPSTCSSRRARASAAEPVIRTGTLRPSMSNRSSRHPVSMSDGGPSLRLSPIRTSATDTGRAIRPLLYQSLVGRSITSANTSRTLVPALVSGTVTVAVVSGGVPAGAGDSPTSKVPAPAPSTSTSTASGVECSSSTTKSISMTPGSNATALLSSSHWPGWGPRRPVHAVAPSPSSTAEARLPRSPARWADDVADAAPVAGLIPTRASISVEGAVVASRAVPEISTSTWAGSGTARTIRSSGSVRTGSLGLDRSRVSTTLRRWSPISPPRRSSSARGVRITSSTGPRPRSTSAKPTGATPA